MSDTYTAWKHLHIEQDRMCTRGGLLFNDYGATGQCGGAGQPACCGTAGQLPCNQVSLYDWTNVVVGDTVTMFSEARPLETSADSVTITAIAPPSGGAVVATLNSPLNNSFRATDNDGIPPPEPLFSNGHAGAICVPSAGFFEADTSGLRQPFDDALVTFHVTVNALRGSGVVPYLPGNILDASGRPCRTDRFDRIWFANYTLGTAQTSCVDIVTPDCARNNYLHVSGARTDPGSLSGISSYTNNWVYALLDDIQQRCNAATSGCTPTKLSNITRAVVGHETGHHFEVNKCQTGPTGRHDSRPAWCSGTGATCAGQVCLMLSFVDPDGFADGIDRFCKEDLVLGDPSCSGTPRDGAIRTVEDPQ